MTPSDEVMKQVAEEMGVGDTFHPTPVGVFFGDSGRRRWTTRTSAAPGPDRNGVHRVRRVHDRLPSPREEHPDEELPLSGRDRPARRSTRSTTVTAVRPLPGGGYAVGPGRPTPGHAAQDAHGRTFTAEQVVFAASALGTQKLLHRMRDEAVLPALSRRGSAS